MSELANCSKCGSLYVQSFRSICSSCYKKQEEDFKLVSGYMRQKDHRMATMLDVCAHTGVEERTIRQFIREGRLLVAAFPNLGYPCESCGNMIQSKRLCAQCQRELNAEIASLTEQESTKSSTNPNRTKQSRLNQFL
ncbi:TIGR03826 family flagellar region protein [Alkalicoccobacillus porphyridii]|uniref:Flagellar protein n=1 Tax=Alkalicoccobacillus porphyridii TaxID=2597270 RepID=A0A554A3S3_9BACI|nr:TIGR03826 family flagellar region protein [Alkalicoccobacillus porphyridii]TSB48344.1 hypothetical protein FN960_01970 [Alkalicoccobacillus porphyridii]